MTKACQLFLVPSRSSNPPLYPSKGCELGSVLQLLLISATFYLGSHLSPLRSWGCVKRYEAYLRNRNANIIQKVAGMLKLDDPEDIPRAVAQLQYYIHGHYMWSSSTSEVVFTTSGFSPRIEWDRGTYVTTSDHSSGSGG